MDKTGLIWKFPVNRELTQPEKDHHLPLDRPVVIPGNVMTTIKMNSTYLECCDKFYFGKGEITATGLFTCIGCCIILTVPLLNIINFPPRSEASFNEWLLFAIFVYATGIPTLLTLWFTGLSKEVFRYTHYPIRFNRKTRMVHVFRLDGTVMSESWDKLYFTIGLGEEYKESKEVRGHRLAEDGKTVLETFALPYVACEMRPRKQWEFVRRYMEKGPAEVLPYIDHVLDVELGQPGKRESFAHGYKMFSTTISNLGFYLFFPLTFPGVIGRWIAMRTCKQPVWPAEINAECAIEPNDPYLVDAKHLPEKVLQAQRIEQGGRDETITSAENLTEEAEFQPGKNKYRQVYLAILFSIMVPAIYALFAALAPSPESYIRKLNEQVEEARQQGLLGETSELLTEIIKIKPNAENYYNRGKYYDHVIRKDGHSKDETVLKWYIRDILKDYARAIEYDPDYVAVYRSRGLFYYEILKDYPNAIQDFTKWIALDPEGAHKVCGESNDCEVLKFLRENNLLHGENTPVTQKQQMEQGR